jgi:hypothetical protein
MRVVITAHQWGSLGESRWTERGCFSFGGTGSKQPPSLPPRFCPPTPQLPNSPIPQFPKRCRILRAAGCHWPSGTNAVAAGAEARMGVGRCPFKQMHECTSCSEPLESGCGWLSMAVDGCRWLWMAVWMAVVMAVWLRNRCKGPGPGLGPRLPRVSPASPGGHLACLVRNGHVTRTFILRAAGPATRCESEEHIKFIRSSVGDPRWWLMERAARNLPVIGDTPARRVLASTRVQVCASVQVQSSDSHKHLHHSQSTQETTQCSNAAFSFNKIKDCRDCN